MHKIKNYVLSCGGARCCPKLSIGKKFVSIKDDYNGHVKITREHAKQLLDILKKDLL